MASTILGLFEVSARQFLAIRFEGEKDIRIPCFAKICFLEVSFPSFFVSLLFLRREAVLRRRPTRLRFLAWLNLAAGVVLAEVAACNSWFKSTEERNTEK